MERRKAYTEAIKTIMAQGKELEAIKDLFSIYEDRMRKIKSDKATLLACVKAIEKINRHKNEAIDALCDWEG